VDSVLPTLLVFSLGKSIVLIYVRFLGGGRGRGRGESEVVLEHRVGTVGGLLLIVAVAFLT
jgi:hypothetical protein